VIPSFRQISLVDSGGRRGRVGSRAIREASGCGRYFKFVDDEHSCATNGATVVTDVYELEAYHVRS